MTFLRNARRKRESLWKQREHVDERKRRDEKRDGMGEEEMETQDGMKEEEMNCFDSSSLPGCPQCPCLWCLWQLNTVPT
jgi:hypothetical protein